MDGLIFDLQRGHSRRDVWQATCQLGDDCGRFDAMGHGGTPQEAVMSLLASIGYLSGRAVDGIREEFGEMIEFSDDDPRGA